MEVLLGNKENNFSNLFSFPTDGQLRNSETSCRMLSASLFFNNLSKQNRKCEMSFSISNNMKKKVENFAKCNTSKGSNFMKYTIDQWSSGCSEFFTSPKPYSYDSNSIASFLIGGFVGSKSQMNNEKHKLSYDLGEVILKIHNIKCKFEEKIYEVKSHRKQKTFKDMNFTYQDQYNIVLVEDSVDSLKNECKEKSNTEKKKCDLTSNSGKVNLESLENEPINNFEPLCNNKMHANDKFQPVAIKATNENCHEKSTDFDETFEDKQNILGSENIDLETVKDLTVGDCEEVLKGDTNSVQCLPSEKRRRQFSECSLESTDSESFIVFDDRCCETICDELENGVPQETENDESDFYFEEDDCDTLHEDDGDSSWIRSGDISVSILIKFHMVIQSSLFTFFAFFKTKTRSLCRMSLTVHR